jgi:hypothetical protein
MTQRLADRFLGGPLLGRRFVVVPGFVRGFVRGVAPVVMLLVVATAVQGACGGAGTPAPTQPDPDVGVMQPGKTEFERRQEAACDALGPRLTQCAYEDARRTMTPAEMAKEEIEAKRPEHTKLIVDKCRKQQMSSRQLRVYEVCMREERECTPLINCLEYAAPTHAGEPAPSRR